MTKICKGKNSCGRTLPEELFYMNRGYRMSLCEECHNTQTRAYRLRHSPMRIDKAQEARDMCNKLMISGEIMDFSVIGINVSKGEMK